MKDDSDQPKAAPLAGDTSTTDAQEVTTQSLQPAMDAVSQIDEGNTTESIEGLDVARAPPREKSEHEQKATATYVSGFPEHHPEMQAVEKDEALVDHPREQSVMPGAVAVPGTGSNEEGELDDLASPVVPDPEGSIPETGSQTTVILEATAVQEIVATQVVTEPHSDLVSPPRPEQPVRVPVGAIQHVEIDTGDDSRDFAVNEEQRPKPEDRQIKRHHVAIVIVVVVGVYTLVGYLVSSMAPSRQEIEADRDDDREVDDCLLAQEDLLYWLERLLVFARIDVLFAVFINILLTYRLFDWCQDKYCRDSTPIVRGEFYVTLVLVLFEFMNLIVGVTFIILMVAHELHEPADLLRDPCETNGAAFQTITEVDEIGSLNVSDATTTTRVSLLLIGILLRVRLVLLNNETLKQLSPSTRCAINCIIAPIDGIALALSSVSIWQVLVVLDEVKAYDPGAE